MKRAGLSLALILASASALYLLGPRPENFRFDHSWPRMPDSAKELEDAVAQSDAGLTIRPDNHSRIVWHDEQKKEKTPLALLYLHGFSASWFEGEPLHRDICREFGMNLYLPRLQAHGIDTSEPLLDLRPEGLYRSALDALALAEKLGERVVIAGTSTGGSLALMLAAEFPQKVSALLLFSPNIRLRDANAWMLTRPWGLQLARLFMGSRFRDSADSDPLVGTYWYTRYRLEGLVALQQLLETTMIPDTFRRVRCPVFMGYYYRDEEHQDPTVSVAAMLEMYEQLGTAPGLRHKTAFPEAGVHVITNGRLNADYPSVLRESLNAFKVMCPI